jgi:hypothetical protein|tara:strand:- start:1191 stop:1973 length:783 start_codon:yes stop_codon:yes gene_type:complete
MMNYKEHFSLCRGLWSGTEKLNINDFYDDPARVVPTDSFGEDYEASIWSAAVKVFAYFSRNNREGIMLKYPDIWSLKDELETICSYLVPHLEETMYGCHLYVDKVYVYRTTKCERDSSYIWHYDNNPDVIVKNIIYLNDVTDDNSPFEYLSKPDGRGHMFKAFRIGPNEWKNAPNGSRVNKEVESLIDKGYNPTKVIGSQGTTFTFNNNTAHRANPIKEGYRDVINIRVKPTMNRISFLSKEHTSSFEAQGVVDPDPEKK